MHLFIMFYLLYTEVRSTSTQIKISYRSLEKRIEQDRYKFLLFQRIISKLSKKNTMQWVRIHKKYQSLTLPITKKKSKRQHTAK